MRKSHFVSLMLILPLFCLIAGCTNSKEKEKPNVIFFLVDDLGWTDLSCFGSDYYQTPHIDQIAKEGVRFTNNYSACTVCSPTRAALMSGKYPARINCTDWIQGHKYPWAKLQVPDWTMYMDTAEFTLAEAFRAAGYKTAHIGKWHLGDDEIHWPENQGFDVNIGGWSKGAPQHRNKNCNGYFSPYCNPRLEDGPDGEYLTKRLAREAIKFIDENKDRPFFLNFWFYNVHTPLQAEEGLIRKYENIVDTSYKHQNPVYAAMIEHTDNAIGKVMQTLDSLGLKENTIIVFNSDNGGLIGRGGRVTSNEPLKNGKGHMYEGGVRVPAIMAWADHLPSGRVLDQPVISMDFYPTIVDLAGIRDVVPPEQMKDGVSLASLVTGQSTEIPREALYWHYPHYHSEGAVPYSAIRFNEWKLIHNIQDSIVEVYNLEKDIGETRNLAQDNMEKTEALLQKLQQWKSEVNAQMPKPNPAWDKERAFRKR